MVTLVGGALTALSAATAITISRAASPLAYSDQTERGRAVFAGVCARCHGQQGQGDQAPRLIGTPNGLAEYKTAQGLFDYVSSQMPIDNPGSLAAEAYWDVVAFILDANNLLPPDVVLGPESAANVKLTP